MAQIELGGEHEELRYFRALTPDEKLENLWMGMRQLAELGNGMIERQDITNGTVKDTKHAIDTHLDDHRREEVEIDFVKRWGGRGTGFLGVLIALSTAILAIDGRIWGWFAR